MSNLLYLIIFQWPDPSAKSFHRSLLKFPIQWHQQLQHQLRRYEVKLLLISSVQQICVHCFVCIFFINCHHHHLILLFQKGHPSCIQLSLFPCCHLGQSFHPAFFLFFSTVLLQVVFNLPLTLWPSVVYPIVVKQSWTPSLLNMCPNQCSTFFVIYLCYSNHSIVCHSFLSSYPQYLSHSKLYRVMHVFKQVISTKQKILICSRRNPQH